MRKVRIICHARMSNRMWHRWGKPYWWVRVGSGPTAEFLPVPRIRGDDEFDAVVCVPDGVTEVTVGVGPRDHGIRELIQLPETRRIDSQAV